jgi:hypothetical protein
MQKHTVILGIGIFLASPTSVSAEEKAQVSCTHGAVTQFLQGKRDSLYGIDPPAYYINADDSKSFSSEAFTDFSQVHRIERGRQTQPWLIPTKVDDSHEQHCNGKSVEDFLNGKCNKLHGFDLRPRNGTLVPQSGMDEFKSIKRFESGGYGFGVDMPPTFEYTPVDRFSPYQHVKPEEWLPPGMRNWEPPFEQKPAK